jgi:hypothetical protein
MGDYKVRSIGEIEQRMREHNISLAQLQESMLVLEKKTPSPWSMTRRQPVSAGRIPMRSTAHCCCAHAEARISLPWSAPCWAAASRWAASSNCSSWPSWLGKESAQEWANYAWQILKSQQQSIIKDGQTLQGDDENICWN